MQLLLSNKAKFQLKESVDFYEKRQKGLGKKLTKWIRTKIKFISKNPLSSEIKYDDVHITYLKNFPFAIDYLYEKELATIFFSAIFHTSQNPQKLK